MAARPAEDALACGVMRQTIARSRQRGVRRERCGLSGFLSMFELGDIEPRFTEASDDRFLMGSLAHFEYERDIHVPRKACRRSVVVHLQHVRAEPGDDAGGGVERPRAIRHGDEQAEKPLALRHVALDQPRQDACIDVAAADHYSGAFISLRQMANEERGDAGSAGAFNDGALKFKQAHDRIGDLVFTHRHDLIDFRCDNRRREIADRLHGDAVGN